FALRSGSHHSLALYYSKSFNTLDCRKPRYMKLAVSVPMPSTMTLVVAEFGLATITFVEPHQFSKLWPADGLAVTEVVPIVYNTELYGYAMPLTVMVPCTTLASM